jgi:hypothetical protein
MAVTRSDLVRTAIRLKLDGLNPHEIRRRLVDIALDQAFGYRRGSLLRRHQVGPIARYRFAHPRSRAADAHLNWRSCVTAGRLAAAQLR